MTDRDDLEAKVRKLIAEIPSAPDKTALNTIRIELLGKNGANTALLKSLGGMECAERVEKSQIYNGWKSQAQEQIAIHEKAFDDAALDARLASETLDVTLPVRPENTGTVHPISQVLDEIVAIFAELGFGVAEGPDVEYDDYNFTRLNVPADHPARQMQDTFYVAAQADGTSHVLRTHTSPVQVRTMLNTKPPIRIISPGRTYRVDSDATHSPMFHQVEALVIDEGITLGHLKWTVEQFCKAFFEIDRIELRARPSFFPFTEPSLEWDMRCDRSTPGKIVFGTGNDWLELGGSGMVHRKVLENCGIDSSKYQGFAFGFGLDRMAMLKYGIPDIRSFFEGDARWLKHYGFAALDIPTLDGGLSR